MLDTRVAHAFLHVGLAVALHYAMTCIADVYQVKANLELPLPPYPGAIVVTRRHLVLA